MMARLKEEQQKLRRKFLVNLEPKKNLLFVSISKKKFGIERLIWDITLT